MTPRILSGARYANTFLSIEDIISPDGSFLKIPRNVILEIKYPSTDMIGSVA